MSSSRLASAKLRQLRDSVVTIDINNRVAFQDYFVVLKGLSEGCRRLTARVPAESDARLYVDLKTFVETASALVRGHIDGNAENNISAKRWLVREMNQQLQVLEGVADRIVANEEQERRTNERLYEMFEESQGSLNHVGGTLDIDQCLEILSLPASTSSLTPIAPSVQRALTISLNFDILRLPSENTLSSLSIASTVDADARGLMEISPAPSAPPLPDPSPCISPYPSIPTSSTIHMHPTSTPTDPTPASAPASTLAPSLAPAHVSKAEKQILACIASIGAVFNFSQLRSSSAFPSPYVAPFELRIGPLVRHYFFKDDYGVSFIPALRCCIPPELQVTREALETNRCFFLSLGMATNMHPFALQTAFRCMAKQILTDNRLNDAGDTPALDLVPTFIEYAGFVDANSFLYLWPDEYHRKCVCIVSNSHTNQPMFSCFTAKGVKSSEIEVDILIHCDGSHFTLLRPARHDGHSILSQLLKDTRQQIGEQFVQVYDQCINILPPGRTSLTSTMNGVLSGM